MHFISVHDGFLKCYLLKSSQTTKLSENIDTYIRIIYFLYNILYKIISSNILKVGHDKNLPNILVPNNKYIQISTRVLYIIM